MSDLILIVDDEPGIRETLRSVLEDEGFEVETAASGEECLGMARRTIMPASCSIYGWGTGSTGWKRFASCARTGAIRRW